MFGEIHNNKTYKNLFDGTWVESINNPINILSPTDENIIGNISSMNKKEIDLSIKNLKSSQKNWEETPINERSNILHKAADIMSNNIDTLSNLLQNEIAKDKKSAISEVKRTIDFIRFTADEGKHINGESLNSENYPGYKRNKISFITRVPVGVVLAISPFNYPINLSISKIAPALIAGNSVLLKPATQGAISTLHAVQIFNKAGIPKGVLNTVTGKGSEIGDYLVTHKDIDFINFTGSSKVGKHIATIAGMIPMLMELGGKDAALVLKDADLEQAAENIVSGAYSYSGQRCTAVKRVLVEEDVADTLVLKLKEKVTTLKVGNPKDECDITPLINKKAADYVEELIKDALDKGAVEIVKSKREGNLIYPALFDKVTPSMRIAWEEPFGPVLPIMRIQNIDEAIKIANSSKYGLQSSIFTKDIDKAFYVANKLEVGTVQINNKTERAPDNFPFLGTKASGMGTQGIRYSIEAMTRPKSIVLNLNK